MSKPFIHLRTLSSYSLSESALKIKNIINLAKQNKMPAIALTDNNNMFGAFEFALECSTNAIQPIIGSSINILDVNYKNKISQLSFLVKNEIGYQNLLHMSSLSQTSENNSVGVYLKDFENYSEGLFCFIGGEFNPLLLLHSNNKDKKIDDFIKLLIKIFKKNLLFELQRIEDIEIQYFEKQFILLAEEFNVPLIGSNNIKFEKKDDFNAHDALLCIAQKTTINSSERITSNPNIYFKNSLEMYQLFEDIPEIVENNFKVALSCNYYPIEIAPKLPKFINNEGLDENDYLIRLSKE